MFYYSPDQPKSRFKEDIDQDLPQQTNGQVYSSYTEWRQARRQERYVKPITQQAEEEKIVPLTNWEDSLRNPRMKFYSPKAKHIKYQEVQQKYHKIINQQAKKPPSNGNQKKDLNKTDVKKQLEQEYCNQQIAQPQKHNDRIESIRIRTSPNTKETSDRQDYYSTDLSQVKVAQGSNQYVLQMLEEEQQKNQELQKQISQLQEVINQTTKLLTLEPKKPNLEIDYESILKQKNDQIRLLQEQKSFISKDGSPDVLALNKLSNSNQELKSEIQNLLLNREKLVVRNDELAKELEITKGIVAISQNRQEELETEIEQLRHQLRQTKQKLADTINLIFEEGGHDLIEKIQSSMFIRQRSQEY